MNKKSKTIIKFVFPIPNLSKFLNHVLVFFTKLDFDILIRMATTNLKTHDKDFVALVFDARNKSLTFRAIDIYELLSLGYCESIVKAKDFNACVAKAMLNNLKQKILTNPN